jgi:hypothetical protein
MGMRVVLDRYTRNSSAEPLLKPYLPSRPEPPHALPLPRSPRLQKPPPSRP